MSQPSKLAAAATSAALSLGFLAVYGSCNWITAQRTDVGTWYYAWERFIPFVPVMIVPYMSIDVFFVAAPFLCQSQSELCVLARRIAFAIVVAGACFLLLPLQLAVPRPSANGWVGGIFSLLHGFDQPHNLFPSLHITLRTILAGLYARHTRGAIRVASHVWFSLIGLSTLLTYQHHLVDVAGGFVLAAFCFYLFREADSRTPVMPNCRVGAFYAGGSLLAMGVALWGWPWTGILLWPAMSLGLTATAYWRLGPAIYRKHQGQIPFSARVLLAPCLFGQYLSLLHYRRQCAAWSRITPNVWISHRLKESEASAARVQGVTAVLDLTAEFSEVRSFRELDYFNLPILDLTAPTPSQLDEAVAFVSQRAARGVVCVHCKVGYSRSAAVVGSYLLATGRVTTVAEAVDLLRRARPTIIVRPEALVALEVYRASRNLPDIERRINPTPFSFRQPGGTPLNHPAPWLITCPFTKLNTTSSPR